MFWVLAAILTRVKVKRFGLDDSTRLYKVVWMAEMVELKLCQIVIILHLSFPHWMFDPCYVRLKFSILSGRDRNRVHFFDKPVVGFLLLPLLLYQLKFLFGLIL